ncbi:D-alanyl-D-alanine-carboxypeptidase/endopeptidase AmpH [Terriglobus aquaticus]|uniref:D-alanyl-D-alanine-carboxypeptidase/endopeptidase AmpH n=1 Tax=Terriglobus aquaticus TaxID=940139 RepID=A0ABW9KH87_9BACT|nr:D-alanyl-D-alanine-carboxypeptidase/endopeptidase AmpH [Terriglobus aquaticus]
MSSAAHLRSAQPAGEAATRAAEPPLGSAQAVAEQIFRRTNSTGMVVVVVRDGDVWMASFGKVAYNSKDQPTPDTLVRLCSITKILTTDVLAKLVAAHTVAFTDPLEKFAPEGVTVPSMTVHGPVDRALTLGDLATHTGGLPREIAYPPVGAAHFTFPDFQYRWQWLPGFRYRTSPGTAAHYSNIGFDLLADALSQATDKSYAELFREKTVQPLALRDTTLSPTSEQCTRLMSSEREPSQCTDTEAAAGSGGMYSTPRDMARLMRYFLGLPGVPVHQNGMSTAMYVDPADLRSVQGLGHAGVPTGIGLGWVEINREYGDSRIVQKTGGGAGFQTYVALNPAHHAGIFIARMQSRRSAGGNMFREANDLLLMLCGLPPVPVDPNDPERERTAEDLEEARDAAPAPARVARVHGGRAPRATALTHEPVRRLPRAQAAARRSPAKAGGAAHVLRKPRLGRRR